MTPRSGLDWRYYCSKLYILDLLSDNTAVPTSANSSLHPTRYRLVCLPADDYRSMPLHELAGGLAIANGPSSHR